MKSSRLQCIIHCLFYICAISVKIIIFLLTSFPYINSLPYWSFSGYIPFIYFYIFLGISFIGPILYISSSIANHFKLYNSKLMACIHRYIFAMLEMLCCIGITLIWSNHFIEKNNNNSLFYGEHTTSYLEYAVYLLMLDRLNDIEIFIYKRGKKNGEEFTCIFYCFSLFISACYCLGFVCGSVASFAYLNSYWSEWVYCTGKKWCSDLITTIIPFIVYGPFFSLSFFGRIFQISHWGDYDVYLKNRNQFSNSFSIGLFYYLIIVMQLLRTNVVVLNYLLFAILFTGMLIYFVHGIYYRMVYIENYKKINP